MILVFTLTDLEKNPSVGVSAQSIYEMVHPGKGNIEQIDPFNEQEFQSTIGRWKNLCQQKRIEIYQTFQQFDRFVVRQIDSITLFLSCRVDTIAVTSPFNSSVNVCRSSV